MSFSCEEIADGLVKFFLRWLGISENNKVTINKKGQKAVATIPLQANPSNQNTDKLLKQFGIPESTRSLLWITDEKLSKVIDPLSYRIEFRTIPKESEDNKYNFYAEPSLIWIRFPIKPSGQKMQEPFYWPTYAKLNPEQKWEYLSWLKDVTQKTNLSYVFLYYYGLERHLLLGDYDGAVNETFKLIKYHKKGSFVDYAISALIAASAHKKRLDIVEKYPEILYEITNESLYLRMLAGEDLTSEDILRFFNQKKVDRNHHVIEMVKSNQVLFRNELEKSFNSFVRINNGLLKKFKTSDLEKSFSFSFANPSFPQEIRSFNVPQLLCNETLQSSIRKIISDTYKKCKQQI